MLQRIWRMVHEWMSVSAAGFWGSRHQKAYFDVKVFNPNAPHLHP